MEKPIQGSVIGGKARPEEGKWDKAVPPIQEHH